MHLKSFYIIRFNNYSCFKPSLLKQTDSKLRLKDMYCEAVCLSSQSRLSLYYTVTSLMFFSPPRTELGTSVRPSWTTPTSWLARYTGHSTGPCLSDSSLLLSCPCWWSPFLPQFAPTALWGTGVFGWRVVKATYWQRPLMLTAWQSCVFILR